MSASAYNEILQYFEEIAINSPVYKHTENGKSSFIKSSISEFSSLENNKLSFPCMLFGFNPQGIDPYIGTISQQNALPTTRIYTINIGIYQEVSKINARESEAETLIYLDELVNALGKQVLEDKANADCGSLRCKLLRNMSSDFRIYRAPTLGDRKALGVVITFNFNITI